MGEVERTRDKHSYQGLKKQIAWEYNNTLKLLGLYSFRGIKQTGQVQRQNQK